MENEVGGMLGTVGSLVMLAFVLFIFIAYWKVFTKANQPGWAIIIPIYNAYILTKIVGRPAWWILLLLVPVVNFIVAIIISIDLAKSFGKDALYGVGIALLGIIFVPMLGFGSATYQGPSASS